MMGSAATIIAVVSMLATLELSYGQQITPMSCTIAPGAFALNATNCQDDDPQGCPILFPGASPTARGTNCDNPAVANLAMSCAFTCKACCLTAPYSCGDYALSPINCTANARFCRDPAWLTIMQTNCPGTCGLCASGSCADVLDDCNPMRFLCNDATFGGYMATNCRRTCLLCSSSVATTASTLCPDIASNCAANAGLCNNSVYFALMTQKCPRTCGRCSSTGVITPTCTDANANCPTWVRNQFCSNSFYTTAQKRSYCARSCGLC
jgi:hypothetical protein